MDKNLLLAIVLSLGVYLAWFTLVEKRTPPPAQPATASRQAAKPVETPGPPAPAATPATGPKEGATRTAASLPQADIEVSNYGMALVSYRFHGPLGPVELVVDPSTGLFSTWPELAFAPAAGRGAFVWEARHPAGFTIGKEFQFGRPGELHHLRLTLTNHGGRPVQVPAWELGVGSGLGTVDSEQKENPKLLRAVGLFPPPEGRTKDALETIKPGEHQGRPRWLAVDNRYFLAAAVDPDALFQKWRVDLVRVDAYEAPALRLVAGGRSLAPGETAAYDVPFYLGPKDYRHLEALGLGLDRTVNFGWFDFIGRPILKVLEFLDKATGNYGWSIILLTAFIQILLFPLTYKSLKATLGMKKIQPEIAKLQQKYKEDPQRLNAELFELYKSKGVNPMGGCLPMLVQMPVFVALYNTLRSAWELHGAPWILWIHDLSAHDPFYILPVVMGGVMFLQNRMNPTATADPTQAQMMTFMPVLMTAMFLKFPAGLVLYWLTNSLMSVTQQLLLRKTIS